MINISGRFPTTTNSEVYSKMMQLNHVSSLILQVVGVSPSIKFLVIQAHSYQHNITASYSPKLTRWNHVNGTNLGLVYEDKDPKMFSIHSNNANISVDIYFSIHAYTVQGILFLSPLLSKYNQCCKETKLVSAAKFEFKSIICGRGIYLALSTTLLFFFLFVPITAHVVRLKGGSREKRWE